MMISVDNLCEPSHRKWPNWEARSLLTIAAIEPLITINLQKSRRFDSSNKMRLSDLCLYEAV